MKPVLRIRSAIGTGRILAVCVSLASMACAGARPRPSVAPRAHAEALLVLPGFGYGRAGERTFESLRPALAEEGIDLYVARYLTRGGLDSGREKLGRFIRDHRLDGYERLHVFAFLAGAWTINPLLERQLPSNLASIVYDRSPFQERAPAIAVDKLRVFAWLRYGLTIFDVARTPYPSMTSSHVKVGLIVEAVPTSFITSHAQAAQAYGPFMFGCGEFHQRYDDCGYVALNHDDLYVRFNEVWPEVREFIRDGRFTGTMNRAAPAGDLPGRRRP
jgi:hypothetical protein